MRTMPTVAGLKGQEFRLADGTAVGRYENPGTALIHADEFGYLEMMTLRHAVFDSENATLPDGFESADDFKTVPSELEDFHDLVLFDLVLDDNALAGYPVMFLYFLKDGSVIATCYLHDPIVTDSDKARAIVKRVAAQHGYLIHGMRYYGKYEQEQTSWEVRVCVDRGSTTPNDLFELTHLLEELLRLPDEEAVADGRARVQLDWRRACTLVTDGFAGYLVGQIESRWLEVKSRGYDLDNFADEIELAQDVARFANGDGPGLLVLGFRTKSVGGLDTIQKATPIYATPKDCLRYRAALDRRIYPPIAGLRIECIPYRGRAIVAIIVPPQDDADKPYLVHGAIVGDRHEGAFISIVRRRDEHSIPVEPSAIHAALVAGRRVIRGS